MTRKQIAVIAAGCMAVLIIASGTWFLASRHDKVVASNMSATRSAQADAGQSSPAAGDLSVGGTGTSLGQLNSNSGGSPVGMGTTSGSSASDPTDPSTFAQYDKYKDSPGALFGEIKAGTGDALTANKKAAVYYRGWLTNGQLFDQNWPNGPTSPQPFTFTIGAHAVIPGWEQAMEGMKVGSTRLLIVPPAVGYGAAGQGPIPGNAVLIFEVQLLAVQ